MTTDELLAEIKWAVFFDNAEDTLYFVIGLLDDLAAACTPEAHPEHGEVFVHGMAEAYCDVRDKLKAIEIP